MTLHHALALDYVTLLTLCDFTKMKRQKLKRYTKFLKLFRVQNIGN